MPKISNDFLFAILRKKGELNLNIKELSNETSISRWVLSDLINKRRNLFHFKTIDLLEKWLYSKI